jgi:hypothetical protein
VPQLGPTNNPQEEVPCVAVSRSVTGPDAPSRSSRTAMLARQLEDRRVHDRTGGVPICGERPGWFSLGAVGRRGGA